MTCASDISKKTDWLKGAPFFVFVWILLVFLLSDLSVYHGLLGFDTDVYLHATQVRTLIDNGVWFDTLFRQYDPPTTQHYSRLSDLLALAVALPLSHVFSTQTAVMLAFATIPVFILLPCYLGLSVLVAKPFVGATWSRLAPLAAVYSGCSICFFLPGQGDHHNLQILLMMAAMGVMLRFFPAAPPAKPAWLGGLFALICSVSIGLGIEGLPLLATFIVSLLLAFVQRPSRAGWAFLGAMAVSLPAFVALLLVATRPAATYDAPVLYQLSTLHVVLALALTALVASAGLVAFAVKNVGLRFALCFLFAGGLGYGLLTLVPALAQGPWMGVDPAVRAIVSLAANLGPTYSAAHKATLFLLVPVLLASFGYVVAFRDATLSGRWLVVALGALTLGVGFASLFYMARLSIWLAPLCVPGLVLAVKTLYLRVQQQPMGRRRVLAELALLSLLGPLNGPVLASIAANMPLVESLAFFIPEREKNEEFLNVVAYFNGLDTKPRPVRILVGPHRDAAGLMFFTPHTLIGSAFQLTDISSATLYFAFFNASTPQALAKVVTEHQIDYVLFYEDYVYDKNLMKGKSVNRSDDGSSVTMARRASDAGPSPNDTEMSWRLRQDTLPSFIERVDLPFGRYRVYKTNYARAAEVRF